jgi:hypothetical protein
MKRPSYQKPVAKPVVKKHVGPNWKLFAHLFIIAALLYAISIAWQNLGKAQAKRQAEIREAAAKRARASDESRAEAQRQAAERITRAPRAPAEFSADDIPAPADTPRESLQRLKDGLLAGDRRETPSSSFDQNDDPPEPSTRPIQTDASQQSGDQSPAGPEFAALQERALELVTAAGRKHKEQLSENARTLEWNLDNWLRGLPKSEQAAWRPHVAQLKEASSRGRVPPAISESSNIRLSAKMEELARSAAAKQTEIDNEFFNTTGTIHRAYLAKIRSSITDAENSGQSATAAALRRAIDSAANYDSWLQSFGVDSRMAADSNQRE